MPPFDRNLAAKLVKRRHVEHRQHLTIWQELADAFEGGSTYKDRVIGSDRYGFARHYLVRHKREYPAPGDHAMVVGLQSGRFGDTATVNPDDDFEMRRARTPVPDFVAEVVRKHLGRIYAREVRREDNPPEYEAWTRDVDGKGTTVDRWFRHEVAPLLYVLGTLDVLCDHPAPPPGESVQSEAHRRRLNLDRVIVRIFQPQDVLWWRLNPDGSYAEVLNRELHENTDDPDEPPVERIRHWTESDWTLYSLSGELIDSGDHGYGRVPQVRLRIGTKHRCEAIGAMPLERAAEIQKEYYNRDSELILSDVVQAHPTLQGPPPDPSDPNSLAVGPGWLLPMVESVRGSGQWQGYEVVDFPKGGAESIRQNLTKLRDELDHAYALAKPAGSSAMGGSGGSTVAQSGISKSYDAATLNDILGELSDTLADAETQIGHLVMDVATDGKWSERAARDPAGAVVSVVYPKQFDLFTADELTQRWHDCLDLIRAGKETADTTAWVVGAVVRNHILPGRSDADYERVDAEVRAMMEAASAAAERMAELADGAGSSAEDEDEDDPDNESEDSEENPNETFGNEQTADGRRRR